MYTLQIDSTDPFFNQALEEYLFFLPLGDDIIYLWQNRPAVVFGCYQNPYLEIDLPRMWDEDVAVVRRISGGGTVYHGPGNINYTWITTPEYIGARYEPFLEPMAAALNRIGYPAEVRNACDIYFADGKVSGSAQKRRSARLLHHGTLLYDCDLAALRRSGQPRRDGCEGKGVPSRPAHVRNLSEAFSPDIPDTAAFRHELADALGLTEGKRLVLTESDLSAIDTLASDKYRSWAWTFGRAPWFRCRRTFRLAETAFDLTFEAKDSVVTEALFRVNSADDPALAKAFQGTVLEKDTLRGWLEAYLGTSDLTVLL